MDVSENPGSSSNIFRPACAIPRPLQNLMTYLAQQKKREDKPVKRFLWFAMAPTLLFAGVAIAQYPVMDRIADKVVQKY